MPSARAWRSRCSGVTRAQVDDVAALETDAQAIGSVNARAVFTRLPNIRVTSVSPPYLKPGKERCSDWSDKIDIDGFGCHSLRRPSVFPARRTDRAGHVPNAHCQFVGFDNFAVDPLNLMPLRSSGMWLPVTISEGYAAECEAAEGNLAALVGDNGGAGAGNYSEEGRRSRAMATEVPGPNWSMLSRYCKKAQVLGEAHRVGHRTSEPKSLVPRHH